MGDKKNSDVRVIQKKKKKEKSSTKPNISAIYNTDANP
jgi:hypothetical protein